MPRVVSQVQREGEISDVKSETSNLGAPSELHPYRSIIAIGLYRAD